MALALLALQLHQCLQRRHSNTLQGKVVMCMMHPTKAIIDVRALHHASKHDAAGNMPSWKFVSSR